MPKKKRHILLSLINRLNETVERIVSWFVLVMVIHTFVVVVLRYFFNVGWVWMQELVIYMHAVVFLLACPATLRKDGHVRVDIFYRNFSPKKQAWVNLLGSLFLLLPACFVIFYVAFPYVVDSWQVMEGSKDGGGLEAVYLLKTLIIVFSVLTALQGISLIGKSYFILKEKNDV